MRTIRKHVVVGVTALFLVHAILSSLVLAQEAVPFMTLADGTKVSMTLAQYDALVKQPGISYAPPGPAPKLFSRRWPSLCRLNWVRLPGGVHRW
jgi:hypothetical protein